MIKRFLKGRIIHLLLFAATFITCMISGTQWANQDFTDLLNWHYGLTYSILILAFLSAHEFGHYFAARYHKVDTTLPYYIPMPLPFILNFGTFGAVIKTKSPIPSRKALFDIGVAGPLAGFVVCCLYLIVGLMTLPTIDFIYNIHPEYLIKYNGQIPAVSLFFGDTLLYSIFAKIFANPSGFLPPMNEIYHYPLLNVGWFGLFVTTLNMLPFGQLDGGHVLYSMFGSKIQYKVAKYSWWIIIAVGAGSFFQLLFELFQYDYPSDLYIFLQNSLLPVLIWIKQNMGWYMNSWGGWIFWALITKFFIKLKHPPVLDDEKIGNNRMIIGWFAIIVLLLSFSYNAIYIIE